MVQIVFFPTKMGTCVVEFDDIGARRLYFTKERIVKGEWEHAEKIASYFEGRCKNLLDIPLNFNSISKFAISIYAFVRHIPYGKTLTYGRVAALLGTSARAVAKVLAKNPLPILVPCHRVVRKDGVGGFLFGASFKRCLILMERRYDRVHP
jgi:methylated-DNA-[protein]-cysteine S-methyltransferase